MCARALIWGRGMACYDLQVMELNGAGEEIRTLDPNLGKVMLYP